MLKGVISREEVAPFTVGMTTAKWKQLDTELVRISDLWATQPGVYFEALINPKPPIGGDDYPHVVVHGGEAYLEDGHTRVTRAALAGEYLVECRVLLV